MLKTFSYFILFLFLDLPDVEAIKVFRSDQSHKYISITKETTAREGTDFKNLYESRIFKDKIYAYNIMNQKSLLGSRAFFTLSV